MFLEVLVGAVLSVSTPPAPVQWDKGSGPAQMAKGLPNPPGWYRAAVGPRPREKVMYLTFDDGPSPQTRRLLDALRRYDAQATFFVAGGAAAANRPVIRRMHRDGHALGNHTWDHPRLTEVTTRVVRRELRRTARAVGPGMGACMRPPYGQIDARVATAAIGAGFQPVLWTAHIEDWAPHSLQWTVDRLRRDTAPGAVILMHDTHAQTVTAVQRMLPQWQRQGYRLAPVPVCDRTIG